MNLDSNDQGQEPTPPDALARILEIARNAVASFTASVATPGEDRFRFEVRQYLGETHDFDRALAVLFEVGEDLGLVTRDAHGQFQSRKPKVSAPASAGAEADDGDGQRRGASEEAIKVMPDPSSAPSSSDASVMAETSAGDAVSEAPSADHSASAANAAGNVVSVEGDEAGHSAPAGETAEEAVPVSSPSEESITSRAATKNARAAAAIFAFKMGTGREIGSYRYSELQRGERESRADAKIFRRVREYAQPVGDPKVADYFAADVLAKIVGRRGAALVAGKKVRRARATK